MFTKRERLKPETVTLRHGASGHWVGNKDAKNVVIYYHGTGCPKSSCRMRIIIVILTVDIETGGGFTLAASPTHFNFYYSEIVKPFNAAGKDVAFFFLEYTLTPHAAYPTQLRQAVEALRYILKDTSRDPSSVIIGGDSAGGNLTLSVLLHIAHPHPDIEPLDLGDENAKLGGAFLCAPWVSFRTDWPSGQTNKYKDVINAECGDRWSSAYLNGKQGDSWSEPFLAPVDWWKDFRAEHVIFITGTDELLYSAIEAFVKKFKVRNCFSFPPRVSIYPLSCRWVLADIPADGQPRYRLCCRT